MKAPIDAAVLEILERARARLTPAGAWTQGKDARDAWGCGINQTATGAVCWCLEAAIEIAAGESGLLLPGRAIATITALVPDGLSPHRYNDKPTTTHADILGLLDNAIAIVRGRLPQQA